MVVPEIDNILLAIGVHKKVSVHYMPTCRSSPNILAQRAMSPACNYVVTECCCVWLSRGEELEALNYQILH